MKKIIGAAAVALSLAVLGACTTWGSYQSQYLPPEKMKKDWTLIVVGMQGGTCKVLRAKPDAMRVLKDDDLMWFVDGDCGEVDIEINAVVKDAKGVEHRLGMPEKLKNKAKQNAKLSTKLHNELPEGDYTYEIRIGGQPAEYRSLAERGAFRVCPDWPCS